MHTLSLSLADLRYHVVTFGVDVYPPVELANERTRLSVFFDEARERWKNLLERLTQSTSDFRISKEFRPAPAETAASGPSYTVETFVLTNRGPVFVFPLVLPAPVEETGLEESYIDDFHQIMRHFLNAVPKRAVMRVGLVRDLIFATGESLCLDLVTEQRTFANANLAGGHILLRFRDEKYNHSLLLEPVQITKTTQLPVGTRVAEHAGYGIKARIDVNNINVQKPLEEGEIQEVVVRATSLWPDELIKLIQDLSKRRLP